LVLIVNKPYCFIYSEGELFFYPYYLCFSFFFFFLSFSSPLFNIFSSFILFSYSAFIFSRSCCLNRLRISSYFCLSLLSLGGVKKFGIIVNKGEFTEYKRKSKSGKIDCYKLTYLREMFFISEDAILLT
jgi:hypothetical protein